MGRRRGQRWPRRRFPAPGREGRTPGVGAGLRLADAAGPHPYCASPEPSYNLLRELNGIQCNRTSERIDPADDIVMLSGTISPVGLTEPMRMRAVEATATPADTVGEVFGAMFGRTTPLLALLAGDVA